MFKVLKSGKRMKKSWKRMITKVTFVGAGFTRKPPKYERFIRPTGLRMTKAHVTHPELKATFCLEIIGIKKNPNGQVRAACMDSAWIPDGSQARRKPCPMEAYDVLDGRQGIMAARQPLDRSLEEGVSRRILAECMLHLTHLTQPSEFLAVGMQMFTTLGVITKGTIIEVNVSELGLVTPGGKVVWGKYAQVGHWALEAQGGTRGLVTPGGKVVWGSTPR